MHKLTEINRRLQYLLSDDQGNDFIGTKPSGIVWLKPRILLDAAAAGVIADAVVEQQDSDTDSQTNDEPNQLVNAANTASKEIIFVDATVENYQDIIDSYSFDVEVIIIDKDSDGIEEIANYIKNQGLNFESNQNKLDTIHIISHGDSGELHLGNAVLNIESMTNEYADELAIINQGLSRDADLFIYGCEFGEGLIGVQSVSLLAEMTGADVAASNDDTGANSLGGNWDLEVRQGIFESNSIVATDWQGLLETPKIQIIAGNNATEGGTDGTFIISVNNSNSLNSIDDNSPITISYTTTGTASEGAANDFTQSGTVTFSNNDRADKTITIAALTDNRIENSETVTITLIDANNYNLVDDTNLHSATIDIIDSTSATATLSLADASADDYTPVSDGPVNDPANTGQFTITLDKTNNTGSDITINYDVSGTATNGADYYTLNGIATIADGQSSTVIDVNPKDDDLIEINESVQITLSNITHAAQNIQDNLSINTNSKTVIITDSESSASTASISITDGNADDSGNNNGQFKIDLGNVNQTGAGINVNYVVSGTAINGVDYTNLNGIATIANGHSYTAIDLQATNNNIIGDSKTTTLTLTNTSQPNLNVDQNNNPQTITITDSDVGTILVTNINGSENNNGIFSFRLVDASNTSQLLTSTTDTIINYNVNGTAIAGTDYNYLTGTSNGDNSATVTLFANQSYTTSTATFIEDNLLETTETIIADLISTDNNKINVSLDDGTINILDNEIATAALSLADASANDKNLINADPTDTGQFTITLDKTNNTGSDITINYDVSGTATNGADYYTLNGIATIANGQSSTVIDINPKGDNLIEIDESVQIKLSSITHAAQNTQNNLSIDTTSQTVIITDSESSASTASISITDGNADDSGNNNGQFKIDLGNVNQTGAGINVNYVVSGTAINGTDYTNLNGIATIANGHSYTTIDLQATNNNIIGDSKTTTLRLTNTSQPNLNVDQNNNPQTITITDSDVGTILVTNINGSENNNGIFSFRLVDASNTSQLLTSTTDTIINYNVNGTAIAGTDYNYLTGTSNGDNSATVTLFANQSYTTSTATFIEDNLLETTETIIADLTSTDNNKINVSPDDSTISILDNEIGFIKVSTTNNGYDNNSSSTNGRFTFNLIDENGNAIISSTNTIINFNVSGTALAGSDYNTLNNNITLAAGLSSQTLDVNVINDDLLEITETVALSLTSPSNQSAPEPNINISNNSQDNNATVNIIDQDTATASIGFVTDAVEGSTVGFFNINLSKSNYTGSDIIINYNDVSAGTIIGNYNYAISNSDYNTLSGQVTIANGFNTTKLNITAIDDLVIENDENVSIALTSTNTPDKITSINTSTNNLFIEDNDSGYIVINKTDATEAEANLLANNGQFIISLNSQADGSGDALTSDKDTIISYSIGGTATNGADYSTINNDLVTIAANTDNSEININILNDNVYEGDEAVELNLTQKTAGNANITLNANTDAEVTITDTSVISVSSSQGSEGNIGTFTLSLSDYFTDNNPLQVSPALNKIFNYTLSGTAINNNDYFDILDNGSITFIEGVSDYSINFNTISDNTVELDETVILTIDLNQLPTDVYNPNTNNPNITGTNLVGTYTILNDDYSSISISKLADKLDPNSSAANNNNSTANFRVSLTNPLDSDLTISYQDITTALTGGNGANYNIDGNYVANSDYILGIEQSIIIKAGATTTNSTITNGTSADVSITIIDDNLIESDSYLQLGLLYDNSAGNEENNTVYNNNTVTLATVNDNILKITDQDQGLISISQNNTNIIDPDSNINDTTVTNSSFTVSTTKQSETDTVINLLATGTATNDTTPANGNADYETLASNVTIQANTSSTTTNINMIDDDIVEANSAIILTLDSIQSGIDKDNNDDGMTIDTTTYNSGEINKTTINIVDQDTSTITLTTIDNNAADPGENNQSTNNASFKINLSQQSATDTYINVSTTGDATKDYDFYYNQEPFLISSYTKESIIDVTIIDDNIVEDQEQIITTLDNIDNGDKDIKIKNANQISTINIEDYDTATLSVSTIINAREPSTDGKIEFRLSNPSDTDTVINYNVSGIARPSSNSEAGDYKSALANLPFSIDNYDTSITIKAGDLTAIQLVEVIDDAFFEGEETINIKIINIASADPDISVSTTDNITLVIIEDNEGPGAPSEPSAIVQFTPPNKIEKINNIISIKELDIKSQADHTQAIDTNKSQDTEVKNEAQEKKYSLSQSSGLIDEAVDKNKAQSQTNKQTMSIENNDAESHDPNAVRAKIILENTKTTLSAGALAQSLKGPPRARRANNKAITINKK